MEKILEKIKKSEKILIVPDGKRVDHDCISSALALKLSLEKFGKKEVQIYVFGSVPKYMSTFVAENKIETKYLNSVDFDSYDLIFLLDAPQWDRVLSDDYKSILDKVSIDKFVNIDHHEYGTIYETAPETVLAKVGEASTTKVIYDLVIKPLGIELDKNIAEMLYIGLVSDSQFFRYGVQKDTLSFGELLLAQGVDHFRILDMTTRVEKGSVDYLTIALEHTNYYPETKLMTLIVDEKLVTALNEKLGEDWAENDFSHYYSDIVAARIHGYDYSLVFKPHSKGTRVMWRSANYNTIAIVEVLQKMEFFGGGHRNAGGGVISNATPEEAEAEFRVLLKAHLTN